MGTSNGQEIKPVVNIPYILTNPVATDVEIINLQERITLAGIYSIQGELLIQTRVSSDEFRINVRSLQTGLYILKLDEVTLKFVKK